MREEPASGTEATGRNGDLEIHAAARTHRGRVRRTNEDSYLCQPPLFVVADGLGGLAAGEIASRLAVDFLSRSQPQPPAAESLVGLLQEASRQIRQAAEDDERLFGMGTTCTALVVADGVAEIAHVGDTRAYVLHAGQLDLLTADHSLAQELVRVGRLSETEATVHASRNTLTRALGGPGDLEVDRVSWPLQPGDRLLLCSDGLNGLVDDAFISTTLAEGSPAESSERLIQAALAAGGIDNVTAMVLDISVAQTAR